MGSYRHETVELDDGIVAMSHYRLGVRPSGLVSATLLAQTGAVYLTNAEKAARGSRLIIPVPIARAIGKFMIGEPTAKSPEVVDSTEVDGLGEFEARGADCWRGLVTERGIGKPVALNLAEITSITEATSPGGLVLPSEAPEVEFRGYVASPDEIGALEGMVARVNQAIPREFPPETSQYI